MDDLVAREGSHRAPKASSRERSQTVGNENESREEILAQVRKAFNTSEVVFLKRHFDITSSFTYMVHLGSKTGQHIGYGVQRGSTFYFYNLQEEQILKLSGRAFLFDGSDVVVFSVQSPLCRALGQGEQCGVRKGACRRASGARGGRRARRCRRLLRRRRLRHCGSQESGRAAAVRDGQQRHFLRARLVGKSVSVDWIVFVFCCFFNLMLQQTRPDQGDFAAAALSLSRAS